VGENRASLIRVSGSKHVFAIFPRIVHFSAFHVAGGRRTRVSRETFGGFFFLLFSLIRDAVAVPNRASVAQISDMLVLS